VSLSVSILIQRLKYQVYKYSMLQIVNFDCKLVDVQSTVFFSYGTAAFINERKLFRLTLQLSNN